MDVGSQAAQSASEWQEVLQRILATRMIHNRAHLEVAIIAYGSNNTKNCLWSEERPGEYAGVDVVSVRFLSPCSSLSVFLSNFRPDRSEPTNF